MQHISWGEIGESLLPLSITAGCVILKPGCKSFAPIFVFQLKPICGFVINGQIQSLAFALCNIGPFR